LSTRFLNIFFFFFATAFYPLFRLVTFSFGPVSTSVFFGLSKASPQKWSVFCWGPYYTPFSHSPQIFGWFRNSWARKLKRFLNHFPAPILRSISRPPCPPNSTAFASCWIRLFSGNVNQTPQELHLSGSPINAFGHPSLLPVHETLPPAIPFVSAIRPYETPLSNYLQTAPSSWNSLIMTTRSPSLHTRLPFPTAPSIRDWN